MFFLVAASLIWSFSFGLIGNLLAGLPPAWLAAVRLAIAVLLFLPFAARVPVRSGLALAVVGALQFGLMSLAYMTSYRYLKSHEVALFTVMTPVYVAAASDLIARRFCLTNLAAALLAVFGAGVIVWRGVSSEAPLIGFLLVEASNLCFALGQLAYREVMARMPHPPADHRASFWLYLGGFAALFPFGLRDALIAAPVPTMRQTAVLLYLGVVVSGVSYLFWNRGARRVPGGVLAVMNNLKIPLGVAVSLCLFSEKASAAGLLAGSLLIAAALVTALQPRWAARRTPRDTPVPRG
ncbi:MAG TPA: EamA family transporter [Kiritimatiellia bacterium]|nr:MAG: EamA-like transporter family protein [Verrucomicrobia bacterium ADurb.Bin070]HQQ91882.1 EamA family transporter [Kiritimatiellia bacterium]